MGWEKKPDHGFIHGGCARGADMPGWARHVCGNLLAKEVVDLTGDLAGTRGKRTLEGVRKPALEKIT